MASVTPPDSRRPSQEADTRQVDDHKESSSQQPKMSAWAKTRQWTQKNKVETGLIIANVLIILGVLAMGTVGTTTGHGISFQDMVNGDAWKISAIALGSLLGVDLLIAGSAKLYKRTQAEKQAQRNEDSVGDAHAADANLSIEDAEADADNTSPPAAALAPGAGSGRSAISSVGELLQTQPAPSTKPKTVIHKPQPPQP
jgi:hypothetical protein